jgi:hypothetical protein
MVVLEFIFLSTIYDNFSLIKDLIHKRVSCTLQCVVKSGYVANCDCGVKSDILEKILVLMQVLEFLPNSRLEFVSQ